MKDTQSPHKLIKSNDIVFLCVKKLKHLQVHSNPVIAMHVMKQSISLFDSSDTELLCVCMHTLSAKILL